ncbi:MAG: hypothetical protein U5K37_05470 [Natrialbaceae archaeon]|nr:hypothetical protein [Natrialbaceae archaeon]
MSESDRATVRTYIPAYQKDHWAEHADELNMSLSEFVRTMVQAGRSDLQIPPLEDTQSPQESTSSSTNDLETVHNRRPRGRGRAGLGGYCRPRNW